MKPIMFFVKKLHLLAGAKLYLNLFGMMLISMIDGAAMLLIIPLLSISGIAGNTMEGIPGMAYVNELIARIPSQFLLPLVLGIYLAIVITQALLMKFQTIQNIKIQQQFIQHIRLDLYRSLLLADWGFFIKRKKSDISHLFTSELQRVNQGTYTFLKLVASLLFTAIQIGIALWLSPELTLLVLVCGVVLILLSRRFSRRAKELGGLSTELSQKYFAGISEHFNGMKDIKSNMLEPNQFERFRRLCYQMENNLLKFTQLQTTTQLLYKMTAGVVIVLVLYAALELFHVRAEEMLVVVLIFARLWPRFSSLQTSVEQINASLPAFNNLIQMQRDSEEAQEVSAASFQTSEQLQIKSGLECRHVYFRYSERPDYALTDISLFIPANQMTAVTGKSGAGKSTLIDILMGLAQPEAGEVLIDGKALDASQLLPLRGSLSYVAQDPFLFHATIRENLKLVNPGATEEKLWEALSFAAADQFVRRLPQGLDTVVGDRGVRLSGGERQRLVLARAILRNPSILVLDEATSALDAENEALIQQALERLKGRMTLIVIAHRLSTIQKADQVLVLEQGRIVQQGGFVQLSQETQGPFHRLLAQQTGLSG